LNFEDERSKLFFEFVRILNEVREVNPNVLFMLENVVMKKEYQQVITQYLGVEPILINSALVSAQNRKRLYWTNIPNVEQPEDKGILLKDIVYETTERCLSEKEVDYMLRSNEKWQASRVNRLEGYCNHPDKKHHCLTASFSKGVPYNCFFEELNKYIVPFDKTLQILDKEVEKGKVGYFRKDSQANRVYYVHGKSVTLCGDAGGGAAKMGQYLFGCITPDRIEKRQNGQRFNDGKKFYTLTAQDKHGVLIEGYIRKLTPIECERLQSLPDNYTQGISDTQRYKALGNGWTVDVIAHIFKNIPQ
jgi:site-specific DNA-cytosine methylase